VWLCSILWVGVTDIMVRSSLMDVKSLKAFLEHRSQLLNGVTNCAGVVKMRRGETAKLFLSCTNMHALYKCLLTMAQNFEAKCVPVK
jgi:hypothetical protein